MSEADRSKWDAFDKNGPCPSPKLDREGLGVRVAKGTIWPERRRVHTVADSFRWPARAPGPEAAEGAAVPARHGVGLDEDEDFPRAGPLARQRDPEDSVPPGEDRAGPAALEHGELLAEGEVLDERQRGRRSGVRTPADRAPDGGPRETVERPEDHGRSGFGEGQEATGRLRSLHGMVVEKKLDLAVRVSSEPLLLRDVTSVSPGEPQRMFKLLSVPFYLVNKLPRLIPEAI